MDFKLVEVDSDITREDFLKLPIKLYKNHKTWIRPLDSDIENVFDKTKNKLLQKGDCIRYLIYQNNGCVGRVAAFIDPKTVNVYDQPTGGMGFFECINDQRAASMLFDACKKWLLAKGVEAMDGPINLGDRNMWWGLYIEGEGRPVYGMSIHHDYYKDLFEAYGFKLYFKQYAYKTEFVLDNLSEIIVWKAKRLEQNKSYSVKHFEKANSDKYISDFVEIYNKAWINDIPGAEEISLDDANNIFKELKPILYDKLMWFAYYEDKPIGFFIMMPDLNEFLVNVNGKLSLWNKLQFINYKFFKKNKNALGLIFGVIPEFQKRGIEAAMIYKFCGYGVDHKFPFSSLEMNWIGDFNPRMMHVMEHIGAKVVKTHHTYRYMFDRNIEFLRSPIIGK